MAAKKQKPHKRKSSSGPDKPGDGTAAGLAGGNDAAAAKDPGATSGTKPEGGLAAPRGGTLLRWLSRPRVAALVAACALAVYLFTLAPTVTTEDSGELVTAAATWGVAHPPGYPLYCLLLQPFVRAPFWSPAFGANLASAVLGAAAAGGVTLVAMRLGAAARFAAAGGLLWAFARDVWAQSVIAEVYTLNAVLLVAIVFLVLRWSAQRRRRDLYGAAGLFGLSLANHHPLMLLALPSIGVFLVRAFRAPAVQAQPPSQSPAQAANRPDRKTLLVALGLLLAGLVPYAYLPLAASGKPPLNWGDPSTWDRFVAHVSRASYRNLEVGQISTAEDKARFVELFFRTLAAQWTAPVLLVLFALGVYRLRRKAKERDLLLGIALFCGLGLTLILNYSYDHENIQRVDEFYLPVYAALAPVLALGLAQGAEEIEKRAPSLRRAASVVLPAVFLLPLVLHFRHNDLSDDRVAYQHNAFALESLPPDSVYYTSGDYSSFPTLYLQAVEGRRPDVILADVTGELSPAARRHLAELDPSVDAGDKGAVQTAFLERGRRPLLVASKSDLRVAAQVEPWGLVYLVRPKDRSPDGARAAAESGPVPGAKERPDVLSAPVTLPENIPGADGLLRSLIADHHLMRGEALFEKGDSEGALAAYRLAVTTQPDSKESVNNVASTAAERRFVADAERWFRKAAALSPGYVTPRRNLARLLDSAGRRDDAIEAFRDLVRAAPDDEGARMRLEELLRGKAASPADRPSSRRVDEMLAAIRAEPDNPALHNNLGNLYAEQGDAPRARAAYEKAITIDPSYALAYKNLAVLHRDLLHDEAAAARYMARYKQLGGK